MIVRTAGEMKGDDILARYYESFGAEKFGNGNLTAQAAMLQTEASDGRHCLCCAAITAS